MRQGCYTLRSICDPVYCTKTGSYFNCAAHGTFNYQNIGFIGWLGSLILLLPVSGTICPKVSPPKLPRLSSGLSRETICFTSHIPPRSNYAYLLTTQYSTVFKNCSRFIQAVQNHLHLTAKTPHVVWGTVRTIHITGANKTSALHSGHWPCWSSPSGVRGGRESRVELHSWEPSASVRRCLSQCYREHAAQRSVYHQQTVTITTLVTVHCVPKMQYINFHW